MSAFSDAVAGGFDAVAAIAGEEVVYRCTLGELTLEAVPTSPQFAADVDEHLAMRYEAKDFLVRTCDLQQLQEGYEPERGALIVVGSLVYKVLTDSDQSPFRYMDTARQLMRIHTKHVDNET